MSSSHGNLHMLPWYVSGKIGQKERQDIDGHLRECEDCRAEVASLTSLMQSLRTHGAEHLAATDLVAYEEEPLSLSSDRLLALELHLAECPECREDFATIQRARREESVPVPLPTLAGKQKFSRRAWALGAAGAAAVLLLVAWPHRFGPSVGRLPRGSVSRAVFPAPRRGVQAGLTLLGTGPWDIRVLLPYDAKQGPYRVQVTRKEGGPPLLDISATMSAEQAVHVYVTSLSGPGIYEMTLTHASGDAESSYRYSFELLARSGSPPEN